MKRIISVMTVAILVTSALNLTAQDIKYARKQLERLCSPEFQGRGYYKKGDSIAASYLADRFKESSLKSYGADYFQSYTFNVNSIEKLSLKFDGKELIFGTDYMIHPSSKSLSGKFRPVILDASLMKSPVQMFSLLTDAGDNKLVVLDSLGLNNPDLFKLVKSILMTGYPGVSAVIEVGSKTPGTGVARKVFPVTYLQINRNILPKTTTEVEINVVNKYDEKYPTRNVIGFLPGKSEKVIVFTAHYDALGSFGDGNYFPGASDNASGTAMVLDLARQLSSGKKPYYSYAFMLFSGEEAGLMGSTWYANHPLFPLEKIKLVINLDMVGTGQDGVNLFNGPQRPVEAAIVQKINEAKHYMKSVDERDGSANSDHYPFHQKDVPAIFFLTKGKAGGGHNTFDTADKLPLYGYENLFKLVIDITGELQRQEIGF
jgi:hypothetical protein